MACAGGHAVGFCTPRALPVGDTRSTLSQKNAGNQVESKENICFLSLLHGVHQLGVDGVDQVAEARQSLNRR